MKNLREIIEKVEESKLKDLKLKFKNTKTNEVLGYDFIYIVDETLFLVPAPDYANNCNLLINAIWNEALSNSWSEYTLRYLNEEDETIEDLDDYISEVGMQQYENDKFEALGSLTVNILLAEDEFYPVNNIKLENDSLILEF